jgi:hypothetical protein
MKKSLSIISALWILATACTTPQMSTSDLSKVGGNDVVLIGKITLNRKLPDSTNVVDVYDVTKSVVIRTDSSPQPLITKDPSSFEKNDIMVKWGEVFTVPVARQSPIFINGMYSLVYNKFGHNTYSFPIIGRVNVKPGAKYLYIGHIHISVDDFFKFKFITITDEFSKDTAKLKHLKGIQKSIFELD